MSAEDLRKQMKKIQESMRNPYNSNYANAGLVLPGFLSDVNLLQQLYGEYIGEAKAHNPHYIDELNNLNKETKGYFERLLESNRSDSGFKLINLASSNISQLLSFVDTLKRNPPSESIPKSSYEKLFVEKEELRKTIEIMVQYKGLPELNCLMETAKNNSLPLDEYWVLALCSSNLIEAVVNKKLEQLGEKAEGNFEDRYKKLCKVIKEKEGRAISQLLPSAVYKVRNKLDHSDFNTVTPKESREISKMVIEFMNEVFASKA